MDLIDNHSAHDAYLGLFDGVSNWFTIMFMLLILTYVFTILLSYSNS